MYQGGSDAAEASSTIAEKTVSLYEDSPEEDDCDPFDESDLEEDEDELADNELGSGRFLTSFFSSLMHKYTHSCITILFRYHPPPLIRASTLFM